MFDLLLFTAEKEDVPYWWTNFMDYHFSHGIASMDQINKNLEPHGVKFYCTGGAHKSWGNRHLIFETEEDCSFFILLWS